MIGLDEEYSQFWKTVVDTMMDGMMIVDPRGTIVSVNRAFEELTGYGREELVGRSCAHLEFDTCPRAREMGGENLCRLFKEGSLAGCNCILRARDGRLIHVLKNAATLRDASGGVIGAVETLTDVTEVVAQREIITRLRTELTQKQGFQGILGQSEAMVRVFELIRSAAGSDAPVVIYGESGTGKELVAAAIHDLGGRSGGPFIKVNCAALSESLLESELFGHVKGAFTGADRLRTGRFEAADGGAILLDEIGDLPPSIQVKLLRVLQEREIERVGDHRPLAIDVRIIAATNKDLGRLMSQGIFRDDLYYRLAVIPIHLPPLRERTDDIPLLVESFVGRLRLRTGKPIEAFSQGALQIMLLYRWPGNVRELQNAIEYAFVLCPGGVIEPDHLPIHVAEARSRGYISPTSVEGFDGTFERQRLIDALRHARGNKTLAAKRLGVSRVTLYKWIHKYNLDVDKVVR